MIFKTEFSKFCSSKSVDSNLEIDNQWQTFHTQTHTHK